MPLTALDPKTALIVIDLQDGVVAVDTEPYSASEVVARSAELADAFRRHGLPVVLVNVDAALGLRSDANPMGERRELTDGMTLAPELGHAASDKIVTKHVTGAFTGTDLEAYLREQGVTQVVVTGIATGGGVLATVQHAYELGFHVTTPVDAMADRDRRTHDFFITEHFPKRAETGTTAQVLALLEASRA